jgi:hypothetical protein
MTRLEYASLMLLQIDFHLVLGAAIVYKYSDKVSAAEDDQRGGKVGAILTERQHMRLRLAATREHLASLDKSKMGQKPFNKKLDRTGTPILHKSLIKSITVL